MTSASSQNRGSVRVAAPGIGAATAPAGWAPAPEIELGRVGVGKDRQPDVPGRVCPTEGVPQEQAPDAPTDSGRVNPQVLDLPSRLRRRDRHEAKRRPFRIGRDPHRPAGDVGRHEGERRSPLRKPRWWIVPMRLRRGRDLAEACRVRWCRGADRDRELARMWRGHLTPASAAVTSTRTKRASLARAAGASTVRPRRQASEGCLGRRGPDYATAAANRWKRSPGRR